MIRWTAGLALVVALFAPVQASAAWVMWTRYDVVNAELDSVGDGPSPWRLETAVPSYEGCANLTRQSAEHSINWIDRATKPLLNDEATKTVALAGGGSLSRIPFKKSSFQGWFQIEFRCYPDTIDPRGPKGR